MKFYVATTLSNAPAANLVADRLIQAGHHQAYRWTDHGAVGHQGQEELQRVASLERAAVLASDVVIVLLCGLDGTYADGRPILRGTHWEAGIADGASKRIIMNDPEAPFEVNDRTCAFYWGGNIERFNLPTIEFADLLARELAVPS